MSVPSPTAPDPGRDAARISDGLALGTAQLGMPYGILGSTPPPEHRVARLLEVAWEEGVRYYDTAQAYGDSEKLLGARLPSSERFGDARIITKLHPDAWQDTGAEIERRLEGSRARLGGREIWALLLHRDQMLDRWDGELGDVLRRWREQGRIRHLGIAVEALETLPAAISLDDLDIVQVPASVFDRRVSSSGLFERARRAGKRVFVRSVYFQGIALADAEAIRARAPAAADMVRAYAEFCQRHGLDRRRFAIDYVRHRLPGAVLLIGAETADQVRENCRLIAAAPADAGLCDAWDQAWRYSDDAVVDLPRLTAQTSSPSVMRIPVVIQARMGSSRLPGKVLMLLDDRPVLQWVVDRARRIKGTDGVVVATSIEARDDAIARYCDRHGITVFRGSEADVLDRYVACGRQLRADAVVRITADCPLLDPAESGRVVAAFRNLPECSYASNISPRSLPDGLDTEVVSMTALEAASRETTDPADREHVTPFVRQKPDRFVSTSVRSPLDAPRYRLTLDTLADFTLITAVTDRLRVRGQAGSLLEVIAVLDQPDLAELRAASESSAPADESPVITSR